MPGNLRVAAELLKADFRVCDRFGAHTASQHPLAWLRWVLSLYHRDLSVLSEGDLRNLKEEAAVLIHLPVYRTMPLREIQELIKILEDTKAIKLLHPSRLYRKKVGSEQVPLVSEEIPLPSEEEIKAFQMKIRSVLDSLLSNDRAEFDPIQTRTIIFRNVPMLLHSREIVQEIVVDCVATGKFADQALYQVQNLLAEYGALVKKCPECEKLFPRHRKNQVYCSRKCQSVVTSRQYRERQKEEITKGRPKRKKTSKRKLKKTKDGKKRR